MVAEQLSAGQLLSARSRELEEWEGEGGLVMRFKNSAPLLSIQRADTALSVARRRVSLVGPASAPLCIR